MTLTETCSTALLLMAFLLPETAAAGIEQDIVNALSPDVASIHALDHQRQTIADNITENREKTAVLGEKVRLLESKLALNKEQLNKARDEFVRLIAVDPDPSGTPEYKVLTDLAKETSLLEKQIAALKATVDDDIVSKELLKLKKSTSYELGRQIDAFRRDYSNYIYDYSNKRKTRMIRGNYPCSAKRSLTDCTHTNTFKESLVARALKKEFSSGQFSYQGVDLEIESYQLVDARQDLNGTLSYTAELTYHLVLSPLLLKVTKDILGIDFDQYQLSLTSNCPTLFEVNQRVIGELNQRAIDEGESLQFKAERGKNTIVAICGVLKQTVVREVEKDQALHFHFDIPAPPPQAEKEQAPANTFANTENKPTSQPVGDAINKVISVSSVIPSPTFSITPIYGAWPAEVEIPFDDNTQSFSDWTINLAANVSVGLSAHLATPLVLRSQAGVTPLEVKINKQPLSTEPVLIIDHTHGKHLAKTHYINLTIGSSDTAFMGLYFGVVSLVLEDNF